MSKKSKTIHESFAKFFENPTRETLRALLKDHVGELRNCDFKESWPDHSGLAKHILGLANSGGGCLVIGVKENADKTTVAIGLSAITDKVDISNGLKNHIPSELLSQIEIADFSFEASEYPKLVGRVFQVLFVHYNPLEIPYISAKAGKDIQASRIYIRREGGTEEVGYNELQRIISERISAAPSTTQARGLKEHLEELKVLYGQIPKSLSGLGVAAVGLANLFGSPIPNPDYPKEDYAAFVARAIEKKKRLIENLLSNTV